jgi:hypothetical protein
LVTRINDLKIFGSLYMVDFTKKTIRESLRFDFLIRTIVTASFAVEVGLTALDVIVTDSSTSSQSLKPGNQDSAKSEFSFMSLDIA